MKRHAMLAAVMVAALAAGAAWGRSHDQRAKTPETAKDFAPILAALKTEAAAFAKAGGDEGPAASEAIANVRYTLASTGELAKALKGGGKPLERLYIAYQLAAPLKMAGDDVLRKLRPTLAKLHADRCKHKPMPRWPAPMLQRLATADDKNAPKARRELAAKDRKKKNAAEQAVIKHNRTVAALEDVIKDLMAMMSDDDADEFLLGQLKHEQAKRLAAYKVTLAAIKAQAARMPAERAKGLYDKLRAIAADAGKPRTRTYAQMHTPAYAPAANSGFKQVKGNFVVETLQVVNHLATAARQPAVNIPGQKKPRKSGGRPGRRRNR